MNNEQTRVRDRTEQDPAHLRRSDDVAGTREGEASALPRHRDPSLTTQAAKSGTQAERRRSGVEWVRPSELLASRTARIAGRGIDFEAELARRTRRVPGQVIRVGGRGARAGARVLSERARRLPPVSDFGRGGGPSHSWVSRSRIGLG